MGVSRFYGIVDTVGYGANVARKAVVRPFAAVAHRYRSEMRMQIGEQIRDCEVCTEEKWCDEHSEAYDKYDE